MEINRDISRIQAFCKSVKGKSVRCRDDRWLGGALNRPGAQGNRCNLLNLTPVAAAPIFSETGGLHTPGCKLCHLVEKTERIKIALSTQQEQLTMLE